MALSLAKAAPLKPGIKLAQALSEFEAILPDDQKTKLRTYRRQSPPSPTDVIRLTAEIDRDASRNRKSRQCVGTRLTNVLHAVQQFSTVVDVIVGSSQSQIAGAIWGAVKLSLQLVSTISSYFDQLTTLFMTVGVTCPRYQEYELLYPKSTRLQSALCEYFVRIVQLCRAAILFLKQPFRTQISFSIIKPFESEFGSVRQDLETIAKIIREEVFLASNHAQQNEAKEMSKFRVFAKNFSDTLARDIVEARAWKRKDTLARKRGNTNWIFDDEAYKQWKEEKKSSTLWCTGILGSGKTVLSANVVEDLKITVPALTVSYFFCKYDEAKSLETRTIIGSIARQIFDDVKLDLVDAIADIRLDTICTDQILKFLEELLPSNSQKHFIIIDGIDECEEKEMILLLQCLKQLLMSKHVFQVYCSSRPDVSRWAHTHLDPKWNVSMSQNNVDIEEYVDDALEKHLELGSLTVGNPAIILTIRDALLNEARGMFLWVAFQIDSICSQKTDGAILTALKDLPKDLPETFNRILRKLQASNAADPQLCRKIFYVVAAAQRPLTLEEICEAISVIPGETSWDARNLVNDMLRSLLDSCGSLIAVDEEHKTVHFAHHSVKQHLVSEPTNPAMKKYHIGIDKADLYLGNIIVTYLNFGIFDRQLAKIKSPMKPQVKKSPMKPQVKNYPSAILAGSLPQSKTANRLAVRFLKSRGNSTLDIDSLFKASAGIKDVSKEELLPVHHFLSYARDYWLFHSKAFHLTKVAGYSLWRRLINEEVNTVVVPWTPENWHDFGDIYLKWITQNEHWALIDQTLVRLSKMMNGHEGNLLSAARSLLELLERKATDINAQIIKFDVMLYVATYMNKKAAVLLALKKGADIDAQGGYYYGNALQAAAQGGHEEIVRLLLENGANVNAGGGTCGTALQAAAQRGHEEIVRLLLENGANVNAEGGKYGTALHAASHDGRKEIVRLLLANGANVNAEGEEYSTALGAAAADGHEEIVRLLLENGANVNAEGGKSGTALHAASLNGGKEIVRLLLENGANVNAEGGYYGTALQAASVCSRKGIVRLLLKNGANVNAESRKYGTALQGAASRGWKKIVRLLLENGANVNVEGGYYGNALRAASVRGDEGIVKLLLENGAIASNEVLEAASALEIRELIRKALKSQS